MHDKRKRRAGETGFAVFLVVLSLFIGWQAYGISGFEALSSPGSFPMAVAAVMTVSALIVLLKTLRIREHDGSRLLRDILPVPILVLIAMIAAYAAALQPLGFLPTSLIFLTVAIRFLAKRGLMRSFVIAVGSLALIYIVFRLVFSVLMPAGIVPEGEILAWFGHLFDGSASR